jgi:branched-chain amino acid aminotransferase
MNTYLFYNGKQLKNDVLLVEANNRGLRYGDGLFETMKYVNGTIHLFHHHVKRLFGGLQFLQFQLPSYFTADYLQKNIHALCQKNNHPVARVRLSVFRGNGGLYDADNHFPHCVIQTWALPAKKFMLNENGLVLGLYPTARKSQDVFANLKSNNYLPYCMAALAAKQQKWNDALLLNGSGNICDTTIANLFIVKNELLFTPPLAEGCVAGVMRQFLLEQLPAKGYSVTEKPIATADIEQADELFVTNAIHGIRWVKQYEEKEYGNNFISELHRKLKEEL